MTALLVVLLVLLAGYVAAAAHRFVQQQALVEEAQAQVEVELRRRRDLVPALVEQVRAYEGHESALARALTAAEGDEERVSAVLLSAQTGPVTHLLAQLAETEDRIAAARRFEAANVRALQVRLRAFPSGLVGRAMGVEPPEVDALTDRQRAELELPPETG